MNHTVEVVYVLSYRNEPSHAAISIHKTEEGAYQRMADLVLTGGWTATDQNTYCDLDGREIDIETRILND